MESVVASPQQQQVIACFTASSRKRHLVLEGPAGTGKTLVALQVANNLIESNKATAKEGLGPVLVVTTQHREEVDPIMRYLDDGTANAATKVFKMYHDIKKEYEVSESEEDKEISLLTKALGKRWEGRQIVMLLDEIGSCGAFKNLNDIDIHESVRMILVVNPVISNIFPTLPSSFLRVTLTTPYRSTIAITSLAQFIAKKKGMLIPEGDFGSDVKGSKPIFFDVGNDEKKMKEALTYSRDQLGDNATILYAGLSDSMKMMVKEQGKEAGGPWACYRAGNFYGWEADQVVAVTTGYSTIELITRAKTRLIFILTSRDSYYEKYEKTKQYFQLVSAQGLVEIKL